MYNKVSHFNFEVWADMHTLPQLSTRSLAADVGAGERNKTTCAWNCDKEAPDLRFGKVQYGHTGPSR